MSLDIHCFPPGSLNVMLNTVLPKMVGHIILFKQMCWCSAHLTLLRIYNHITGSSRTQPLAYFAKDL